VTASERPMRYSTWTCPPTAAIRSSPRNAASARSSTMIECRARRSLMSAVIAVPPVQPGDQSTAGASPAATGAVEFRYTQTDGFVELLHRLGASLLVSTYQANKLLAVRAGGGLSTLVRTFDKPMGLAADGGRLALGTRQEVWVFRNAPDLAPRVEPPGTTPASCRARRTSPETSPSTNSPGRGRSCGW